MDIYHIWCDLKPGVRDVDFVAKARSYLDSLRQSGSLSAFRITRRKLGLGLPELHEFHLMLEFENLTQLDSAFGTVASRTDPVESLHHAVNSQVSQVKFALYRDFPDPGREVGQERF